MYEKAWFQSVCVAEDGSSGSGGTKEIYYKSTEFYDVTFKGPSTGRYFRQGIRIIE